MAGHIFFVSFFSFGISSPMGIYFQDCYQSVLKIVFLFLDRSYYFLESYSVVFFDTDNIISFLLLSELTLLCSLRF